MASELTLRSSSGVQTEAEVQILNRLGEDLGLTLIRNPGRILVGAAFVKVDGSTEDETVLVEVYARQGPPKGAQPKKVAQDILKFALVKREASRQATRTIIAFASDEARQSIVGWVKEAAQAFNVELRVVQISGELRAAILSAQARQTMVNKSAESI